ncbi:MAG: DUF2997 domain-containing protein [Verrucomicrobiota bacterium]
MKQIKVIISEDGSVEIEAVGFKGNSCERATAALEKALGVKTGGKKKPEYRQEDKTHLHN